MKSKTVERLLKTTDLKTRLYVTNHSFFIRLVSELGDREEKLWSGEIGRAHV
jgi:hypothetical protein